MWQYNYTQYSDELYHYGIPGMKWGHRKALPISSQRARYDAAKQQYKSDKKTYNKSYNKAYNYSGMHPISQFVSKKAKAESDKRWEDVYDKAAQLRKSKSAMKEAKEEYKNSAEGRAAAAKRAKALKVGAAVAGTALATYGTYKLSKVVKDKQKQKLYEEYTNKVIKDQEALRQKISDAKKR